MIAFINQKVGTKMTVIHLVHVEEVVALGVLKIQIDSFFKEISVELFAYVSRDVIYLLNIEFKT